MHALAAGHFPLTSIFQKRYIPFVEWEVEFTDEFCGWWDDLSEDEHLTALEKEGLVNG